MKQMTLIVALFAALTGFWCSPAEGTWSDDPLQNNLVSGEDGNQILPAITSDGAGGVIVTWEGPAERVYAQRMDASGNPAWGPSGIEICSGSGGKMTPQVVADGSSGAIIVWMDWETDRVRSQRVDSSGNVLWVSSGVFLSDVVGRYAPPVPRAISDGAGGVVVSWTTAHEEMDEQDVYVQRVGPLGGLLWGEEGITLGKGICAPGSVELAGDGAGGAVVAWYDGPGLESDVYAQRVSAEGDVLWGAGGIGLCGVPGPQYRPQVVGDGASGAVVVWLDSRNGGEQTDVYAQRISAAGSILWTADGVAVCAAEGRQCGVRLLGDGGGGAIVAWEDGRNIDFDLYAQRIDAWGNPLWSVDGTAICTEEGWQGWASLLSDGRGGAILTWADARGFDHQYNGVDVYAQRVDPSGNTFWADGGIVVCGGARAKDGARLAGDGSGGTIAVWADNRTSWWDIYAQRIDRSGQLGQPSPKLIEVGDPVWPTAKMLHGSHPNPFLEATTLELDLPEPASVRLEVYDVRGRLVRVLVDEFQTAGRKQVVWDGTDMIGEAVASGVYYCRMRTPGHESTVTLTVLK